MKRSRPNRSRAGNNYGNSRRANSMRSGSKQAGSKHAAFWNKEYQTSEHLALSQNPSEDLMKFCRWQERNFGNDILNKYTYVVDLGCGNGRNLVYLAREFYCQGIGYDISEEAVVQAEELATTLPLSSTSVSPLQFSVRSISEPLPMADESAGLVLDMMSSHFLHQAEREGLRAEILRVLKPTGWLFFKGFLADGDLHVKRLLREHPANEPNAYIHPRLGVYEYVWTEQALRDFFEPYFEIGKIDKSHKHLLHGKAFKRRTVSVYLRKR